MNPDQAVARIEHWIATRTHTYVSFTAVYLLMKAREDPLLHTILANAGMVAPDGMPLVLMGRLMGYQLARVYAPDMMLALSEVSARKGYRNYYYGSTPEVVSRLVENLSHRFPGLPIAGYHSPPFRDQDADEDDEIIQHINDDEPDLIWLGLGSPKQDYWMARHRHRLNAPVILGVGMSFDIYAGRIQQAPLWMRQNSLEWLFRLWLEPRRLAKRYLVYNPLFLLHAALQLSGLRRYSAMGSVNENFVP